MSKSKRGMFYMLWTGAIFLVLIIALVAIVIAAVSEAREPVQVIEAPGVSDAPGSSSDLPASQPGSDAPASAVSFVPLSETADMGQDYLDKFVFLGDSTTYSLEYHKLVQPEQVWTPLSGTLSLHQWDSSAVVSWDDSATETMLVDKLAAVKPEYILITLGVNGVSLLDEEGFTGYYTKLVRAVQEKSPDTKIILNSIYPVCASYPYQDSINNTKIDAANGWIQNVARATGVAYLSSASVLKGADGALPEDADMDDGIHLNKASCELVLNYLRTHAYE